MNTLERSILTVWTNIQYSSCSRETWIIWHYLRGKYIFFKLWPLVGFEGIITLEVNKCCLNTFLFYDVLKRMCGLFFTCQNRFVNVKANSCFQHNHYWGVKFKCFFIILLCTGISSCVRTVDTVMCLHTVFRQYSRSINNSLFSQRIHANPVIWVVRYQG